MSPDGSTKPLPEEKLLKLIREKGQRVPAATAVAGVLPGSAARAELGVEVPGFRWTTVVAAGLGVVLLMEAGFLVVQLVRPAPTVNVSVPAGVARSSTGEPVSPVALQDVPSLAQIAPATLFTASDVTGGTPTPRPGAHAGPSAMAKSLAARLTLMGIVAGNPAQAILEDSETKKTYFATTGQVVVEGAVLEQVLDNRVILNLDGEKIEISL